MRAPSLMPKLAAMASADPSVNVQERRRPARSLAPSATKSASGLNMSSRTDLLGTESGAVVAITSETFERAASTKVARFDGFGSSWSPNEIGGDCASFASKSRLTADVNRPSAAKYAGSRGDTAVAVLA